MEKDKILLKELEYVRQKKSFQAAGCTIPKEIINYNNPTGQLLNIPDLIKKSLLKISGNENSFVRDLNKIIKSEGVIKEKYYQQFPFIIDNRYLWTDKCCAKYNIKDRKQLNTNFFKIDVYFWNFRCAVEIDSELHDESYDKARDAYLMNINNARIKTLRIPWYNKYRQRYDGSWELVERNIEGLRKIYKQLKSYHENIVIPDPPRLDFSMAGLVAIKKTYLTEFTVLEWIMESNLESNVTGKDIIDFAKKNNLSIDRDRITNIKKFAFDIFEVVLNNVK